MKIVSLDIGGTSIKSCLFDNEKLTDMRETNNDGKLGGEHLVKMALEIVSSYGKFNRIGISTAGQVNSDKGIIIYANENIPKYTGTDLRHIFSKEFGVEVAVENDVNAAALGEASFGAGQNSSDFLCLTYGTGIGGAIVIDKKIYKGASFSAGEFGHIITHGIKGGYYESYASTTALVKNVEAINPRLDNGRDIFANMNDDAVKSAIDDWINEILLGLASLTHIFNPSLIVLGGGVMSNAYVIASIKERLTDYIMSSYANVAVTPASLGNTAGLYGAYYLAKERMQ